MENQTQAKTYGLVESAANKKLIYELEASGARVVRFPPTETEKIELGAQSVALIEDLTPFDWLIFADVFAVDFFLERLEENERDFYELDCLRICAVGEAVSDRLRFAQIHADVVPNSVAPEAVAASLAAYVGEREIAGVKFLFIKKFGARIETENKLKERGAVVSPLEIYRAALASRELARPKALLAGGAVDEFVFAAPADFFAVEALAALAKIELAPILRDAKISATDEVTAQFLRERDLKSSPFRRRTN